MIKRNSVVSDESDHNGSGWTPFGRVVTIKDGSAFVVFCTKDSYWVPLDKLKEHDYKGRWDRCFMKSYWGRYHEDLTDDEDHVYYIWRAMPSLRRLKQMISFYDTTVWKKPGKKTGRERFFG